MRNTLTLIMLLAFLGLDAQNAPAEKKFVLSIKSGISEMAEAKVGDYYENISDIHPILDSLHTQIRYDARLTVKLKHRHYLSTGLALWNQQLSFAYVLCGIIPPCFEEETEITQFYLSPIALYGFKLLGSRHTNLKVFQGLQGNFSLDYFKYGPTRLFSLNYQLELEFQYLTNKGLGVSISPFYSKPITGYLTDRKYRQPNYGLVLGLLVAM